MENELLLVNHLLVAMPSIQDPYFSRSVIFVCEHHARGTVGMMINRPMAFPLGFIFEQLHIQTVFSEIKQRPLLFGGPLQPERGFVIHRPGGTWQSSLALLPNEVTITTSNDIIRAIAENHAPKDLLVALGYVGWDSQQLEQEVMKNSWLVCPYKSELLYEVPFEQRWEYAGSIIGVKMQQLITGEGHA